jgi:hypothetical protein
MSSIKETLNNANVLVTTQNVSKNTVLKLEQECNKHLSNVNNKLQMCINMFNTVINDICKSVLKTSPNDPTLQTYSGVVTEIIEASPVEPISLFVLYIYKDPVYRKNIADGNENFFIDGDHQSMTKGDKNKVATMFQFKSSWKNFDEAQKDYIKNATKMLLTIAESYIIEKDNGNKIAEAMLKISKVNVVN